MSPMTFDLFFTVAASCALLSMLGLVAALLPWTDAELEDTEDAFRALLAPTRSAPVRVRRPAFLANRGEVPVYGQIVRR